MKNKSFLNKKQEGLRRKKDAATIISGRTSNNMNQKEVKEESTFKRLNKQGDQKINFLNTRNAEQINRKYL